MAHTCLTRVIRVHVSSARMSLSPTAGGMVWWSRHPSSEVSPVVLGLQEETFLDHSRAGTGVQVRGEPGHLS